MSRKLHFSSVSLVLLQVVLADGLIQSCDNSGFVFRAIFEGGSSNTGIYTSFTKSSSGDVCQLNNTCCSSEAEDVFQRSAVRHYKRLFVKMLTSHIRSCQNLPIFNKSAKYILINKEVLLQDFFTASYRIEAEHLVIVDDFFDYLANAMHTGNLEKLQDNYFEMFFEMFLAVYLYETNGVYIPSTEKARQCFYNFFLEKVETKLKQSLSAFQRKFSIIMRYLRALRVGDRIIDSMLGYRLTVQCEQSLMKMKYCANCAGYSSSLQSCNGLCVNTIRGCFVDLLDLVEPIEAYSEALAAMRDLVKQLNPYNELIFLNQEIISVVTEMVYNKRSAAQTVDMRCPRNANGKKKRALTRGKRASPAIPTINAPPLHELDPSSRCLSENAGALNSAIDALCYGDETKATNEECWNGQVYGNYEHNVLSYNRVEQQDNPEMVVCQNSQFSRDISLLRYITKELTSITSRCSHDDEDCTEVQDTNRYYDFDSIDLSSTTPIPSEEMIMSGSGSGDSNDEMCQLGTPTLRETPPAHNTPDTSEGLATVDVQSGCSELSSGSAFFLYFMLLLATSLLI